MQEDPWYPQEWWLDQDSDGLTDNYELYHGTNPLLPDTNGDGVSDLLAVLSGISPTAGDTDGDGMSNALEILNGTDPLLMDTDGDGVHDNLDAFPLDASRSQPVSGSPSDITPPLISLLEPIGA
ncbi:MAG: hypothetical protein ACK46A_08005, partial [Akkermansiaceae bacterium]